MGIYADYAQWAAEPDTRKVHAVELVPARISDRAELELYWSDDATVGDWDGVHFFEPCVLEIPRLVQKAQKLTSGSSLVSYGDLVLALEPERKVDPAGQVSWSQLLEHYAFRGRPVTIKLGGPGLDYQAWGVVLQGYLGQPSYHEQKVSLPVYSPAQAVLETQAPPHTYDDSYPQSAQGRAIPLCYGYCQNVSPVLVSENPWVFQCHDPALGPIQAVDAVYVDGLPLTGGYSLDLAQATVSFGSDPQGAVTLDLHGACPGGTYLDKVGQIVRELLLSLGGVAAGDIDQDSFDAYDAEVPFPVGLYLDRQTDLARVLDSLVNGLLTIWGPDRRGRWSLRRFGPPQGEPALEVSDREILEGSFKLEAEERLYWKVTVAGERNWSVNSSPAAAVPAGRRQWLAQAFRQRQAQDQAVRELYPHTAQEASLQTHLVQLDHCATVAGWWLEMFGARRRRVSLNLKMQGLELALGQVIRVSSQAPGFEQGALARLVRVEERHGKQNLMTLEAWL